MSTAITCRALRRRLRAWDDKYIHHPQLGLRARWSPSGYGLGFSLLALQPFGWAGRNSFQNELERDRRGLPAGRTDPCGHGRTRPLQRAGCAPGRAGACVSIGVRRASPRDPGARTRGSPSIRRPCRSAPGKSSSPHLARPPPGGRSWGRVGREASPPPAAARERL